MIGPWSTPTRSLASPIFTATISHHTSAIYDLYKVYDATNYEKLSFGVGLGSDASSYYILSRKGGTGSVRALRVGTETGGIVTLEVNNVAYLTASSGGVQILSGTTGFNVASGTATPAGGSTAARLLLGTTSGFGIYYGSGAPTVSAAQGSLYLRSDGSSTSTRLYVNTDGGTTWTNVTTAA